jgi:hypothetical protein
MSDGVVVLQVAAQLGQALVLGIFESVALQAFQLDAHRIVIAIAFASVFRGPGVPGAVVAADKLPKRAVASDQEVRRHLQAANALKVRVGIPVELVGEEAKHRVAAILAGRQADGVDHDQVDASCRRAWPKIR